MWHTFNRNVVNEIGLQENVSLQSHISKENACPQYTKMKSKEGYRIAKNIFANSLKLKVNLTLCLTSYRATKFPVFS